MWSSHIYHEPSPTLLVILTSFLYFLNLFGWLAQRLVSAGLLGQILIGIIYGTPVAGWLGEEYEEAIVGIGYVGLLIVVFEGEPFPYKYVQSMRLICRRDDYLTRGSGSITAPIGLCCFDWTVGSDRSVIHTYARVRISPHPLFRSRSSFIIHLPRHYPHRPPTASYRVRSPSIQTRCCPAQRSRNGRRRSFHLC